MNKDKKSGKLHSIFRHIKNTPLARPLYYIMDFHFMMHYKLLGKAKISDDDRKNVEDNVTFIFKSFNRQRSAKRLWKSIRLYYPEAKIVIADDSKKPLILNDSLVEVIQLPFNVGLGKGVSEALKRVETPYLMRLDDDMLLTPDSNIHKHLKFLQNNDSIDLISLQATNGDPEKYAEIYKRIKFNTNLIIPAGTKIENYEVLYKTANVYLARTDKIKMIGYDPLIRMIDHNEFFYRAAGKIVCAHDPKSYVMHCHNKFEKDYDQYRSDIQDDRQYITLKHGKSYWKNN